MPVHSKCEVYDMMKYSIIAVLVLYSAPFPSTIAWNLSRKCAHVMVFFVFLPT